VDVRHRRDPLAAEEIRELRPIRVGLRLTGVLPVVLPGHAPARPEGLHHVSGSSEGSDDGRRDGRGERKAVLVEQDLVVALREPVPPGLGLGRRVLDLEDPGYGLLLEPLSSVPLVRAGGGRELARPQRAAVGERTVEAELAADVDAEEVEGAERGAEEPLDERLAARIDSGVGTRHGFPPFAERLSQ
jgi:hypothetical protein